MLDAARRDASRRLKIGASPLLLFGEKLVNKHESKSGMLKKHIPFACVALWQLTILEFCRCEVGFFFTCTVSKDPL
jgi:hypothetical protein